MKNKFCIGDIVCLNSSPHVVMTVYNVTNSGTVATKYFDSRKTLKIGLFNQDTLKMIKSKN